MSDKRTIKNALISVFHKDGLESIVTKAKRAESQYLFHRWDTKIY